MAFTSISKDMNIISVLSNLPNEDDGLTAEELKEKFDEGGLALKEYINDTLLSELEGVSGSEKLGAKAISGVAGANIYLQISDLKTQLDELTMGSIPDNSLETIKLKDGCITNAKLNSEVTALITALYNTKIPTGTILPFAGSSAPSNALLCDGSAVSRNTYATLYSVIGTAYGIGDGSTTFNVPNLKGKIPVGYNSSESEFNALGKAGGEKTHLLTSSEMPTHNHTQDAHIHTVYNANSGGSSYGFDPTKITGTLATSNRLADSQGSSLLVGVSDSRTPSISSSGGSSAHNNIQPYITVNYIIIAQ